MKNVISKTLVGVLFLTSICVSPLTMGNGAHAHRSGHTEISSQMQSESLACCEGHEKEAGGVISVTTPKEGGKAKITLPGQNLLTGISGSRSDFADGIPPSAPPDHKYLASVIRLE